MKFLGWMTYGDIRRFHLLKKGKNEHFPGAVVKTRAECRPAGMKVQPKVDSFRDLVAAVTSQIRLEHRISKISADDF